MPELCRFPPLLSSSRSIGPPAAAVRASATSSSTSSCSQEGHLSADQLVDLIRAKDSRISRATIYRTLQWMVDAGIARRVDFGEGRFRFEHAYRHPRHFHLICKTCNQSFEFLSSDIEALLEEVATARNFSPQPERAANLRDVRKLPEAAARPCRRRRRPRPSSRATRCASRLRPSAAGSSSTRAPRGWRRMRAAGRYSRSSPARRRSTCASSRTRYQALVAADPEARVAADVPVLQGRGQRPVRGRHRGAQEGRRRPQGAARRHPLRARLAPVLQAVRRALRGVGRQAHLPRVRRRGARAPRSADSRIPAALIARQAPARARRPPPRDRRDRSPPAHDRLRRPVHVRTRSSAKPRPPACTTLAVTDHDTVAGSGRRGRSAHRHGMTFVPGIEITAVDAGRDVHVLGYFFDPADAGAGRVSRRPARRPPPAGVEMRERLARVRRARGRPGAVETPEIAGPRRSAGRSSRRRWSTPGTRATSPSAFARTSHDGRPAFVAAAWRDSGRGRRADRPRRGTRVARPSGETAPGGDLVRELANAGLAGIEVFHPDHGPDDVERFGRIADECGLVITGGSDYHGPGSGRAQALGRVGLPADAFDRVLARAGGRRRP